MCRMVAPASRPWFCEVGTHPNSPATRRRHETRVITAGDVASPSNGLEQ
jgi:hypothetical protein